MANTTEDKLRYLIRSKEDVRLAIERMQISCPEDTPFLDYGPKIKQVDVDLSDATVTSDDLMEGVIAYDSKEQRLVGTIPELGPLNFEPSDEEHTIPYGRTNGGKVNKADITKLAEYEACLTIANSVDNLDDYTDTTATAMDIREGKIAYTNGERVTGVMPDSNSLFSATGLTTFTVAKSLRGILKLDIPENCTDFSSAFSGCTNLISIPDLDGVSITAATYMFNDCQNLLEIPKMNINNITSGNYMFSNCKVLTSIPSASTTKMTNAQYMFSGCSSLENIPEFDFTKVTNGSYMFNNCTSLKGTQTLNAPAMVTGSGVFRYCNNIEALNINFTKIQNLQYAFQDCTLLKQINFIEGNTYNHAISNMENMCDGCESLESFAIGIYNISASNGSKYTFRNCKKLKDVTIVQQSNYNILDQSTESMFENCESLETFPNIPKVFNSTSYNMFKGCKSLKSVPALKLKGPCASIFENCEALETVECLEFTSSISAETNNRYIFKNCKNLKNVTLKFTANISALNYVFENCASLTEIPPEMIEHSALAGWNSTFKGCTSLTTVPANIWDSRAAVGVIGAVQCFSGCTNLTDVGQFKFAVNNGDAQYVAGMFGNCPNLTNESLNNIMGGLASATWSRGTRTLKNIGFSAAQATICTTLSNWSLLTAQNWTTGY